MDSNLAAARRVSEDTARGLAALLTPTEHIAAYQDSRAVIDAKELLRGLDEVSIENLGFGRITARTLRFACRQARVRIIDVNYNEDAFVADILSDLLKAGKVLMEARCK